MEWRRITLHVTQFEPLCCDDARNLQDIVEVNVGIPLIVDIFLAFDRVGEHNEHVFFHRHRPSILDC